MSHKLYVYDKYGNAAYVDDDVIDKIIDEQCKNSVSDTCAEAIFPNELEEAEKKDVVKKNNKKNKHQTTEAQSQEEFHKENYAYSEYTGFEDQIKEFWERNGANRFDDLFLQRDFYQSLKYLIDHLISSHAKKHHIKPEFIRHLDDDEDDENERYFQYCKKILQGHSHVYALSYSDKYDKNNF
jgi:hypothetical protein